MKTFSSENQRVLSHVSREDLSRLSQVQFGLFQRHSVYQKKPGHFAAVNHFLVSLQYNFVIHLPIRFAVITGIMISIF